jgi:hypothetical protein
MNRSFISVIAGGFGVAEGTVAAVSKEDDGKEVQATSDEETADLLRSAKQVIFVPGYGMAVAQAQHIVHEITKNLLNRNVSVKFAVHPVAGAGLRFGLPAKMPAALKKRIKRCDIYCAWFEATQIAGFEKDEANTLFKRPPKGLSLTLSPLPVREAEQAFLKRFEEL